MEGSAVMAPCPISEAGDMSVIVPSPSIVTQALAWNGAAALAVSASSKTPKVTAIPRAPSCGLCPLSGPRNALDGSDDSAIGAAAADVAVHVLNDLLARRLRILF